DLGARHIDAESRVERGDPADGWCFTVGVAVPEDHVLDRGRVEPGAVDQLTQHRGGERGDRDVTELAAETADRGTNRFADDDLVQRCHSSLSLLSLSLTRMPHVPRGPTIGIAERTQM